MCVLILYIAIQYILFDYIIENLLDFCQILGRSERGFMYSFSGHIYYIHISARMSQEKQG